MNPFDVGYFTEYELKDFGFKRLGKNVSIAKNCTIIGLQNISIGDNVRIDGYSTIVATGDGFLNIGSFIHIGGYSLLSAGAGITMNDFSGISQGVRIYSKTDDYTGEHLTNPTIPYKYTGVTSGEVVLGRHSIIGSGTVILPKVTVGDGSSVGALSLVTKNLPDWGVYFGTPAKKIKNRKKNLLSLEKSFLSEMSGK
ncbi:acyltransferase [Pectobacterium actinidiae]|uniref:acyltransferase n=1 Tax=Pectobacterium actinidiae TaxID=1507808 RepID=UPI004040B3AF